MFGLDLPLFLALFAFAFQGTSDFFLKSGVVRKGDPFSIMAMTVPSFVLTSAVFGAALGALEFNRATFLYGPVTGVLSFIAMNLFVTSLKHGEASVNTMLFRLSFIVTSFLTIGFLGESAGWSKWLGLALASGAVCSVALGGGALRVGSNKGITLAVAALVSYGINAFCFKLAALNGVQAPAFSVVTSSCFGLASIILHFLPWGGFRFQASPAVFRYGLLTGFLMAVMFNCIVWAMSLGAEASVVMPILQLSFVLTAALAVISLKEPVNGRKALGFTLAIAALIVFAL